jgi:hypothetical protein
MKCPPFFVETHVLIDSLLIQDTAQFSRVIHQASLEYLQWAFTLYYSVVWQKVLLSTENLLPARPVGLRITVSGDHVFPKSVLRRITRSSGPGRSAALSLRASTTAINVPFFVTASAGMR